MLKKRIPNLESVAENLKQFYEPAADGNGFTLMIDTEGEPDEKAAGGNAEVTALQEKLNEAQKKVSEFRDNNTDLKKKMETLEEQIKAIGDPEEAKKALELAKELQDKEVRESGDMDKILAHRLEAATKDHDTKIKAMQEQIDEAQKQANEYKNSLHSLKLSQVIGEAIQTHGGVRTSAIPDVVARASSTWKVTDSGEIEARNAAGEKIYGGKGKDLTVSEWLEGLQAEAPHCFESSSGSGAPGSEGGSSDNPGMIKPGEEGSNLEAIASGAARVAPTS